MFIVIEGIDGAGCETQAKMVYERLKSHSGKRMKGAHPESDSGVASLPRMTVSLIKFPHYDTPVGKMIKDFLYQNQKMKAHEQFLLYTLQFIFDAEMIKKFSEKAQMPVLRQSPGSPFRVRRSKNTASSFKDILIADRYFTTTLCYQTLEGFDEKVALRYADDFGIIRPDVVFFLDVKPETAIKWKCGEGKELNFREKDLDFMKRTYEKYQDLINRQTWTKWVRIDGERNKEVIAGEIISKIQNL